MSGKNDVGSTIPTVEAVIGGRKRRLRMSLGALKRMRHVLGSEFQPNEGEVPEPEDGLDRFGPFVWAVLVPEDAEGLTAESIQEEIAISEIGPLSEALRQLMGATAAEGPEGGERPLHVVASASTTPNLETRRKTKTGTSGKKKRTKTTAHP